MPRTMPRLRRFRFFCCRLGDCDKRVILLRSRIVACSMAAKALHPSNRSALMRMTGSDEAGSQSKNDARVYCIVSLHLVTAVAAFLSTIIKRWHHKQMAHVLWHQRCLEVASRLHHVGVDEPRRTYRHHGTQRTRLAHRNDPRRRASQHIATQRLCRWGSPAARARLARTLPSIACGSETPTAASRRLKPRRSDNEGAS
ncbi:hypothetical protein V1278_000094 [Bradyrhizobium sp. AZCC 1577]